MGQPLNYFFPIKARIRIAKDELNTKETQLIEAFKTFDNFEVEDLVLTFVVGLANYSRKGSVRRFVDDTTEVFKLATGKKD